MPYRCNCQADEGRAFYSVLVLHQNIFKQSVAWEKWKKGQTERTASPELLRDSILLWATHDTMEKAAVKHLADTVTVTER